MKQEHTQSVVITIEDNELAMTIADHLRQADLKTLICNESNHALSFIIAKRASLIIIDAELPENSGIKLAETLQEQKDKTPIILLDAEANGSTNKIKGVETCKKPINYTALVEKTKQMISASRTRSIATRRKRTPLAIEPFRFCGGDIDPHRMEVTFPLGHVEKIGRKELSIIAYLRDNPDTVITRETMIKAIWGDDANTESRSLDQYIVKVRDLYKRHGLELIPFRTVHGVGYIYDTN